ncbi:MAG: ice-binding family protein [Thermoleophilaceae bacterium]
MAQAQVVDLGTAGSFVVLGGASVTNTGPSVLNGDLGVSPGTSLTGFGSPAVVNGATHNNDGVASQAQLDLATAYDAAAAQPVLPADDLTGTDLGNRTLTSGVYRYSSSAQLTGALTLDAEGNPDAEFIFQIGSTLTTASASSVVLINGASPCNVYWQIGTSATLGTTTAFQGNVMTLADISLNDGATVIGRLLARTAGAVTLINNVLTRPECATESTPAPDATPPATDGDDTALTPAQIRARRIARARARARAARQGRARMKRARRNSCTDGFRAIVRGRRIARVVFRLDGRRISSRRNSPFRVHIPATRGGHLVRARVTFKDKTRAKTMTMRYRACAAQLLRPRRGPSQYTG